MTDKTTMGDSATTVTAAVGRTIRKLRTEQGWSLDVLSARANVSKAVLVNIEQGRSNPNLATLVRLSEAFSLPVTRLVEIDEAPIGKVLGPESVVQLWTGELGGTGTLIAGTDPPDGIEVWRWEMPSGESYASEAHKPGTTEVVVVERGVLSLDVGGTTFSVPAGSSMVFAADRDHTYTNRGKTHVTFMDVVTIVSPTR